MKKVQLNEVCVPDGIQTGPFGSQLHQSDYSEEGIPVIMPVNLIDGGISEQNMARVSEDHVDRLSKYKVAEGDIVYARRGDVGRCSRVTENESGWLCGTGCLRITPDNKTIDGQYLFYLLSLPSVVGWVRNNAKGTTMPNLNTEILSSVPLNIEPDVSKQKKLAGVLSTYDSLIENNRKQIKLFEEAAQRLYKEWFIDLRFPGHETTAIDSETGLPEGWSRILLGEYTEFRRGKVITEKQTSFGIVPVVAGGLGPAYYHDTPNTTAPVITISGSGANAGFTRLYNEDIWASDCSFVDSSNCEAVYFVFETVLLLGNGFKHLQRGSAQPHVYPKNINELNIVMPSEEILDNYEGYASCLFLKIRALEKQITLAKEARNRLIPNLMEACND